MKIKSGCEENIDELTKKRGILFGPTRAVYTVDHLDNTPPQHNYLLTKSETSNEHLINSWLSTVLWGIHSITAQEEMLARRIWWVIFSCANDFLKKYAQFSWSQTPAYHWCKGYIHISPLWKWSTYVSFYNMYLFSY